MGRSLFSDQRCCAHECRTRSSYSRFHSSLLLRELRSAPPRDSSHPDLQPLKPVVFHEVTLSPAIPRNSPSDRRGRNEWTAPKTSFASSFLPGVLRTFGKHAPPG